MLRVTYFVPIYGFPWASPTLSSLLFYSSCGLLFRIMNDSTTNNFLKYEKAVILSNFSPIFLSLRLITSILKIARHPKYTI